MEIDYLELDELHYEFKIRDISLIEGDIYSFALAKEILRWYLSRKAPAHCNLSGLDPMEEVNVCERKLRDLCYALEGQPSSTTFSDKDLDYLDSRLLHLYGRLDRLRVDSHNPTLSEKKMNIATKCLCALDEVYELRTLDQSVSSPVCECADTLNVLPPLSISSPSSPEFLYPISDAVLYSSTLLSGFSTVPSRTSDPFSLTSGIFLRSADALRYRPDDLSPLPDLPSHTSEVPYLHSYQLSRPFTAVSYPRSVLPLPKLLLRAFSRLSRSLHVPSRPLCLLSHASTFTYLLDLVSPSHFAFTVVFLDAIDEPFDPFDSRLPSDLFSHAADGISPSQTFSPFRDHVSTPSGQVARAVSRHLGSPAPDLGDYFLRPYLQAVAIMSPPVLLCSVRFSSTFGWCRCVLCVCERAHDPVLGPFLLAIDSPVTRRHFRYWLWGHRGPDSPFPFCAVCARVFPVMTVRVE